MLSRVVDAMRSEAPMPPLCTLTTPTPLLFTGSGACSEQRQALNTNERSKVETTIKRSLCTQSCGIEGVHSAAASATATVAGDVPSSS